MKKTAAIILLFLLLFVSSSAITEEESIVFHGIPWLSSQEVVKELITDYIDAGFAISELSPTEGIFIQTDDILNAHPMVTGSSSDLSLCTLMTGSTEKKIAGYYVKSVLFTYAFNGFDSKLICVKVDLAGAKYIDLLSKLTKVYGEGKTSTNEEGLKTTIWEASGKSCVLLYSADGGETADLLYGRLDAEQIIKESAVVDTNNVDPDDVTGL